LRVLVLGASGYLGGRIAGDLSAAGHAVVAQLRRAPEGADRWRASLSKVITGDLRDPATLEQLAAEKAEAAVHVVALNHTQSEKSVEDALAVNVGTVWSALKALQPAGLKRWIYFSTQQVYGRFSPGERLDEERRPAPVNAYGITHLQAELVGELFERNTGIKSVNLRLSNGCGAPAFKSADCWWLVVNDLCRTAVEKNEIRLSSDGTPQRDFIHLSDVTGSVRHLLEAPADRLTHPRYLLGGGRTSTILELAHEVARIFRSRTGRDVPILLPGGAVTPPADAHQAVPRFSYDISRLRSTGWEPKHTVASAIEEVFDFLGLPRGGA
jgi:UDP-glucose 4-epimerase